MKAVSYSPIGRATRGYVAFRKDIPYLAFLKTYWWANIEDASSELAIYEALTRHEVPYVARALGGGDTQGKGTVTQEYLNNENLAERVQCIIVIEQLAKPLEDYEDSLQLISIVYQALCGTYTVADMTTNLKFTLTDFFRPSSRLCESRCPPS